MPYHTYILQSETSKKHYYGHSGDLPQRILTHNSGKVRSTKNGRPWLLHYAEEFQTKSEAYRRELFFKSFEGRKWLKENKIV